MLVEHAGVARAYPVRSLISPRDGQRRRRRPAGGGHLVAPVQHRDHVRPAGGRASGGVRRQRGPLPLGTRHVRPPYDLTVAAAARQGRAGPAAREELAVVPWSLLPWSEARDAHPGIDVVLGSQDELRQTTNPYDGYEVSGNPFLIRGETDDRLPAFVRVAGVTFDGVSQAWSYGVLRRRRALSATVGGQPLVVLWAPGSAPPLETEDVREGRDVGSTGAYDPRVDGRALTFRPSRRTQFSDRASGSRWSLAGLAVDGPLKGTRLSALPPRTPSGSLGRTSSRIRRWSANSRIWSQLRHHRGRTVAASCGR